MAHRQTYQNGNGAIYEEGSALPPGSTIGAVAVEIPELLGAR
jgi:hypothetical protein